MTAIDETNDDVRLILRSLDLN